MKVKLKTLNPTNLLAVQSNKISVQIGANQQEGAVMTQLLISFLGKARKEEGQYRQANYQFENNQTETARFFSEALTKVITPKRLVMLGTSGSMWDVLCENLGHDEQQFELIEAVENNAVTQPLLDHFSDLFSEKLNVECVLKLIPYGDDVTQQVAILQKMAEDVKEGDSVALDLTHGLRHLPMLGLLSAMYLKTARNVNIEGIYYGALERTNPETKLTPVMRLDGLLTMADWISALDGFNKTGNIAPFSELLQRDGMDKQTAQCLEEAAFFENTLNIPNARSPLKKFAEATKEGLKGIGALFQENLQKRISWCKEDNLYLRQRENAYFYLNQGDYLRAATLGYEAFITLQMQQDKHASRLDRTNFEHRNEIKQKMERNQNAKMLNHLRNAVAHGTRSDIADVQRALSSKEKLQTELERLFKTLLPKESK
jgi:CRISPR-associated Csx2 family protein